MQPALLHPTIVKALKGTRNFNPLPVLTDSWNLKRSFTEELKSVSIVLYCTCLAKSDFVFISHSRHATRTYCFVHSSGPIISVFGVFNAKWVQNYTKDGSQIASALPVKAKETKLENVLSCKVVMAPYRGNECVPSPHMTAEQKWVSGLSDIVLKRKKKKELRCAPFENKKEP